MVANVKQIDAVRMMRSIRDRISRETNGMSFEQEQAYIRKHLGDDITTRFGVGGEEPKKKPRICSTRTPE